MLLKGILVSLPNLGGWELPPFPQPLLLNYFIELFRDFLGFWVHKKLVCQLAERIPLSFPHLACVTRRMLW